LNLPVWPLVLWEPAVGWLLSGAAGMAALWICGFGARVLLLGLVIHTILWLAAEAWFMSGRGLSFSPRAAAAALVREALVPVLMVRALSGRRIDWRGTDLGGGWRRRGRGDGRRETSV
jgi:ceramide glucosyltransferase